MNMTFSQTCKDIHFLLQLEPFSNDLVAKIKNHIDKSYASDDEDIEDLGDIIMLLNQHTERMIKDLTNYTNSHVAEMIVLRVYAKKSVKTKFRDFKYKGRKFWNDDEAFFQYQELVKQWKESVNSLPIMTHKYRPDITFNNDD